MIPEPDLASSTYCLANKGKEYLVYLPESREVVIDLQDAIGLFEVKWFNPDHGEFEESETINGGSKLSLTSPFETSDVLLYLEAKQTTFLNQNRSHLLQDSIGDANETVIEN